MARRCPDCGSSNEDSRIYCSYCGELLDPQLRLIKDLEKHQATPTKTQPEVRKRDDDDEYIPRKKVQEKKSSPLPLIILGVIVVVVVVALLFL